jgi:hypothetical protein
LKSFSKFAAKISGFALLRILVTSEQNGAKFWNHFHQSYDSELQRQRCKNLQRNKLHGVFLANPKRVFHFIAGCELRRMESGGARSPGLSQRRRPCQAVAASAVIAAYSSWHLPVVAAAAVAVVGYSLTYPGRKFHTLV